MFGAAMPGEKFVRKATYVGHVSEVHLKAARQRFRTSWDEKIVQFGAAETSAKPESSCFVWVIATVCTAGNFGISRPCRSRPESKRASSPRLHVTYMVRVSSWAPQTSSIRDRNEAGFTSSG